MLTDFDDCDTSFASILTDEMLIFAVFRSSETDALHIFDDFVIFSEFAVTGTLNKSELLVLITVDTLTN
jgi:hypothetical protein